MTVDLDDNQRLVYAVGVIVLTCQEIEMLLKHLVPFTEAGRCDVPAILARHAKLAKRPLGEVARKFVGAWTGDTEPLVALVQRVVEQRNEVVHHFTQTYGALISAGRQEEVIGRLRRQHEDALELRLLLREMMTLLGEALRDTITPGTAESERFSQLSQD